MRVTNSVITRVSLRSNPRVDKNISLPADSQMQLAYVHEVFDEWLTLRTAYAEL